MRLDVQKLRDSRFAAEVEPEAFRAGVLLWCAAWHQVPAGSLPNNDVELSGLAGFGRVLSAWREVKEQALQGFVLCSDGRLYHETVAEKANAAWEARLRHFYDRAVDRLYKVNKARKNAGQEPLTAIAFEAWNAGRLASGAALDKAEAYVTPTEPPRPSAGTPPLSDGNPTSTPTETPQASDGNQPAGGPPSDGNPPAGAPPSDGIPPENALKGKGSGSRRESLKGEDLLSSAGADDPPDQVAEAKAGRQAKGQPIIPCPYRLIVDAYHDELPSLPRVKIFDGPTWDARCRAMREIWGWVLSSKRGDGTRRAETADEALAWLRAYFARARDNDFLMGRTARPAQHANWRCTLDFLLSKPGVIQVLERTEDAA